MRIGQEREEFMSQHEQRPNDPIFPIKRDFSLKKGLFILKRLSLAALPLASGRTLQNKKAD